MPVPDLGEFHATALVEAEGRYHAHAEEGPPGFLLRRLYLGARWSPRPWATVSATINAANPLSESVIFDGWVRVKPWGPLDLTLGHFKSPFLASTREPPIETSPVPELSLPARTFWPGRDSAVEAHLAGPELPVEVWARVGNGSRDPLGNDDVHPAYEARADVVIGRARAGADRAMPFGLRAGAGVHAETTGGRAGLTGKLPTGFTFWTPPAVEGPMWIAEGHVVLLVGPVQATVEAAGGSESRRGADATQAWGAAGEVAWMVGGSHRLPGAWPVAGEDPDLELAARVERLSLGLEADDLTPGGAWGVEGTARAWDPHGLAFGLTAGWFPFDTPAPSDAAETDTWLVAARATARLR